MSSRRVRCRRGRPVGMALIASVASCSASSLRSRAHQNLARVDEHPSVARRGEAGSELVNPLVWAAGGLVGASEQERDVGHLLPQRSQAGDRILWEAPRDLAHGNDGSGLLWAAVGEPVELSNWPLAEPGEAAQCPAKRGVVVGQVGGRAQMADRGCRVAGGLGDPTLEQTAVEPSAKTGQEGGGDVMAAGDRGGRGHLRDDERVGGFTRSGVAIGGTEAERDDRVPVLVDGGDPARFSDGTVAGAGPTASEVARLDRCGDGLVEICVACRRAVALRSFSQHDRKLQVKSRVFGPVDDGRAGERDGIRGPLCGLECPELDPREKSPLVVLGVEVVPQPGDDGLVVVVEAVTDDANEEVVGSHLLRLFE